MYWYMYIAHAGWLEINKITVKKSIARSNIPQSTMHEKGKLRYTIYMYATLFL